MDTSMLGVACGTCTTAKVSYGLVKNQAARQVVFKAAASLAWMASQTAATVPQYIFFIVAGSCDLPQVQPRIYFIRGRKILLAPTLPTSSELNQLGGFADVQPPCCTLPVDFADLIVEERTV